MRSPVNRLILSLLLTPVSPGSSMAADAPPGFGNAQTRAAERIAALDQEGQYELSAQDGSVYYLTLLRATHNKAYLSLVDSRILVQKSFLYLEFDQTRQAYIAADGFDPGEGTVIKGAQLTIDAEKNAVLRLLFASEESRWLRGRRIDSLPRLDRETTPLECSQSYTGEIGLSDGSAMKGEITLYPSDNQQLMAIFRNESNTLRREFRSGDQKGDLYLTSTAGKNRTFLHLRLSRAPDGELRGYSVVSGLGRSSRPTVFSPKAKNACD